MAKKYSDIIKLRAGRSAYNIKEEKAGEWTSFIPNEQFNGVLRTVIKSVRGNDIDNHKSFWINGTYGTGKSHAVAVLKHLLSDPVDDIRKWVDYEYREAKFESIRQSIYNLREKKQLLPVNVYGLGVMTVVSDLSLVIQRAVTEALSHEKINLSVNTDFQTLISHIKEHPQIWDNLIESNEVLSSIVTDRQKLIKNLEQYDLDTYHRINDALRDVQFDIRLKNENIGQWLIDIQNALSKNSSQIINNP